MRRTDHFLFTDREDSLASRPEEKQGKKVLQNNREVNSEGDQDRKYMAYPISQEILAGEGKSKRDSL